MAKEKKICPVPLMALHCREKECAWWDSLAKSCAILVIAKLGGTGSEGSYHNHPQKKS